MQPTSEEHRERLLETIRRSIIGDDEAFEGPFGVRKFTYADYTASGRSLTFIEDYLRDEVLPRYANTHTEISGTGRQTTMFREQARALVREAVNATDDDAVIFCGTGATGAVNKLIGIMNLRIPNDLDRRYGFREQVQEADRPVVLVGPFEHHSNELPWKESVADVVHIDLNEDGGICIRHLEDQLKRFAERPLKIGSFSAASNVTGITSDIDGISRLLHEHGALSFWDYAAAGPYIDVKMNDANGYRDAIFISPHKFIGGPGCPGLLIVKRALCVNRVPVEPGGGTVSWVRADDHDYIDSIEVREEGGTPDIIGAIRTGLVFQLKEAVGVDYIRAREDDFVRRVIARWRQHPNIEILGNHEHERISIVSFLLRHGEKYLHWSYVVALLNDLFGIQARGGCSCAGPYGHLLLGIDRDTSTAFEALIHRGLEGAKPGWIRLNFNYFINDTVFEFLLSAVEFVADHGWKLLPCYEFDVEANVWQHRAGYQAPPMNLHDVCYAYGRIEYEARHIRKPESVVGSYLDEARELIAGLPEALADTVIEDPVFDRDLEQLRWFPMPGEALAELLDERLTVAESVDVELIAVIVAVTDDEPRVLTIAGTDPASGAARPALPSGALEPERDPTLDRALRRWVREQAGLEVGHVEQLYTFGDQARHPREEAGGSRLLSVAYLALVREEQPSEGAVWRPWYDLFPWEDHRDGAPPLLGPPIEPALHRWIDEDPESADQRRERAMVNFALEHSRWDPVRALERYEILYEVGLVAESNTGSALGDIPLILDHRRIAATALGRIRGKLTYRPVIFELLPQTFTLLRLQLVVEALHGVRLHKQNFRRLVERGGLVEGTGEREESTGGRPAELFRFRREVVLERLRPGLGAPPRTRA